MHFPRFLWDDLESNPTEGKMCHGVPLHQQPLSLAVNPPHQLVHTACGTEAALLRQLCAVTPFPALVPIQPLLHGFTEHGEQAGDCRQGLLLLCLCAFVSGSLRFTAVSVTQIFDHSRPGHMSAVKISRKKSMLTARLDFHAGESLKAK